MLYSRSILAGLVAGSSLLMTMSTALAHDDLLGASASKTEVAALPLSQIMGDPTAGALSTEIERLVMADALEAYLGGRLDGSAIQAARMAYAQDLFQPIWTRDGAASLVELSHNLFSYGLLVDEVEAGAIDRVASERFDAVLPADRAQADLTLTVTWMRIASAVSGGLKDEGAAVASLANQPSRSLLTTALLRAGEGDAAGTLAPFEVQNAQYKGLKKALLKYRDLQQQGGWFAIRSGETIREGDRDSRVPAIRSRLQAEGYEIGWDNDSRPMSPAPTSEPLVEASLQTQPVGGSAADILIEPNVMDAPLVAALKVFQNRHGLEPDGVVGPMTLAALNESVESKIDRIVNAMNQWRQQGDLGQRHVWANIPSFTVEGWNGGTREIRMRTIVGKPSRETPIFSDEIEYTVANPKWYVPVSIARRDKLPKLQQDASYADRQGFNVYERSTGLKVSSSSVNWQDPSSATRYRLVQDPGAGNALGELKIIFPNRHAVYLHGTPGASLFKRASRAYSSGCIRLEDPVAMANWLASHDTKASVAQIQKAVASGQNRHIRFGAPIPVHLTYMTVTVDEEGVPNFWRDIYNRDKQIHYVEQFAPTAVQTTASVALDSMGQKTPAD